MTIFLFDNFYQFRNFLPFNMHFNYFTIIKMTSS